MRHELRLTLETLDVAALLRGHSIALTIGDQVVMLDAESAAAAPVNGRKPTKPTGGTTGICGYCKRNLRVSKHAKNCRVLRKASAQLALRRKAAK
jgi:hypothetical protein